MNHYNNVWHRHAFDDQPASTFPGSAHFDWTSLSVSSNWAGMKSTLIPVVFYASNPSPNDYSASVDNPGTSLMDDTSSTNTTLDSVDLSGSTPEFVAGFITTIDLDAPPSVAAGTLSVDGGSVAVRINSESEPDWFRISLTAGQISAFNLQAVDPDNGTQSAPFLYLQDRTGQFILASNFDHGTGYAVHDRDR